MFYYFALVFPYICAKSELSSVNRLNVFPYFVNCTKNEHVKLLRHASRAYKNLLFVGVTDRKKSRLVGNGNLPAASSSGR